MEKKAYHLIIFLILSIMVVVPAAAQGFVQILDVKSNTTLDNGADKALESFYEADPVLASLSGDDQVLESFYEADWVLESFNSRVIFRIASNSNDEINSSYAVQPNWTQAGLEMVFVGCPDEASQSNNTIQVMIAEGAFKKSGSNRYTADPGDIDAFIIGPDGKPSKLNLQLYSLQARLVERPRKGIYVAQVDWSRGVTPSAQNANMAGEVAPSANLPVFSTREAFLTVKGIDSPQVKVTGSTSLACR
jgi:hypothetical protein